MTSDLDSDRVSADARLPSLFSYLYSLAQGQKPLAELLQRKDIEKQLHRSSEAVIPTRAHASVSD
jgi:hypothetical protein